MFINDRVYGEWELTDPLALALVKLPAFQRLYKVGQYGSRWMALPEEDVNRAEHSLGVYYLLKHFNASREEQIAGLLHDISHSAFSHVIDYLRGDPHGQGGQDKAHGSFIERQADIKELLQAARLDYRAVSSLGQYKLLDRDLPDLCCDRLDYFFRDSICFNRLTPDEAQNLLKHIVLAGDFLVLDDPEIARFMAKHSINMTFACWGPPYGVLIYQRTVAALRRALEINLITEDDFWTTDQEVWNKLRSASDEIILSAVFDVENIRQLKLCHDEQDFDYHGRDKFRAIDPLVFWDNKPQRVSEIFPDLADLLKTEKQRYERGYYIKIIH